MRRIVICSAGVLIAAGILVPAMRLLRSPQQAPRGEVRAYYLPGNDTCTVLVDFAGQRAQLSTLDSEHFAPCLAEQMIEEFGRTGVAQANGAKAIRMIAVYIEGKDNYNRPDFSKRVNLLELSASADELRNLSGAKDNDWNRLKASLNAKLY